MFLSVDGRARGIARAYRPCCEVVLSSVVVGAAARGLKRGVSGASGLCPCRVPVTGGCSLFLPMVCWWWASADGLFSASADAEVPVSVGRRFGIMPVPRDLPWVYEVADSPKRRVPGGNRQSGGIKAKPRKPNVFNGFRGSNPGGGYEIRTREAVTPTRFPSVRHRPLGESSIACGNAFVCVTGQLE